MFLTRNAIQFCKRMLLKAYIIINYPLNNYPLVYYFLKAKYTAPSIKAKLTRYFQ
jgi:hypothetical protein